MLQSWRLYQYGDGIFLPATNVFNIVKEIVKEINYWKNAVLLIVEPAPGELPEQHLHNSVSYDWF